MFMYYMLNCSIQMPDRLIILFIVSSLIVSCTDNKAETSNKTQQRKLVSFHSYQDSIVSKNSIFLGIPEYDNNELKNISVKLTHGAGCTAMSNLIITIYTDNNEFRIIADDFRFLVPEFNSIGDTTVEKAFNLVTSKFRSPTDSVDIDYTNLMKELNSSKRIAISATMNDFALLYNPLSSSSLRHSNLIEYIYE